MNVLVMGGSGFIGSQLTSALCAAGHQVRILSRKKPVALELRKSSIEVMQCDLLDSFSGLERLIAGCSIVFNCVGELHNENIMEALHVDATFRLLSACKNVAKMTGQSIHWVQLSSVGAYGPLADAPGAARTVTEDTVPVPIGIYEKTKTQADKLIMGAAEKSVFSYTIVRPSNVYGSEMPNNSLRQWGSMIKKKLFFYVGAPGAVATYIHVSDVVDALMLCGFDERAKGEIFNISNDCSQKELVDAMAKFLNVSPPKLCVPEWLMRLVSSAFVGVKGFPITHSRIDALVARTNYPVDKLEAVLGYRPTRIVKETITEVFSDDGNFR